MTAAGAIKFHWIHPHNIFEEVLRILSGFTLALHPNSNFFSLSALS